MVPDCTTAGVFGVCDEGYGGAYLAYGGSCGDSCIYGDWGDRIGERVSRTTAFGPASTARLIRENPFQYPRRIASL